MFKDSKKLEAAMSSLLQQKKKHINKIIIITKTIKITIIKIFFDKLYNNGKT